LSTLRPACPRPEIAVAGEPGAPVVPASAGRLAGGEAI